VKRGFASTARCACFLLALTVTACSARHREAASAAALNDTIAAQPALRACESRTFDASGIEVTLTSNVDATLAGIRMQDADPAQRAQIAAAVRQRFGIVKHDPRVQTRPNKWGLTVVIDSCGRPLDLSGQTKSSAAQ
jgi:hypothetical protein